MRPSPWIKRVLTLLLLGMAMLAITPAVSARGRSYSWTALQAGSELGPAPSPPVSAASKPVPPSNPRAASSAEKLLALARDQEAAGDLPACLRSMEVFINLYPAHPERPNLLLKIGRLARRTGQHQKASQVYTLAALLYPDTQAATQARTESAILNLYRALPEGDAIAAFRTFLDLVFSGPQLPTPALLQEPLRTGWEGVAREVSGLPASSTETLEQILSLWQVQPPAFRPPEAAQLMVELLLERGLLEEAKEILGWLKKRQGPGGYAQMLAKLSEQACRRQDYPGFAFLMELGREAAGAGEHLPELTASPAAAAFTGAGASGPGEVMVSQEWRLLAGWFGPTPAEASPGLLLDPQGWQRLPLSREWRERLLLGLAEDYWSKGNLAAAANIYQSLLADNPPEDLAAVYRDRLGVLHVKAKRWDAALDCFQASNQGNDSLGRLLAGVRLLDLELARSRKASGLP